MKAVVAAFNQEKALVGAFYVITNLRMELFEALMLSERKQEEETSGNTRDQGHSVPGKSKLCLHKLLSRNFSDVLRNYKLSDKIVK